LSLHELQQIRRAFQGLQTLYQTHLPKVDSGLIHDLLIRELNKKSDDTSTLPPFYIVEIRTTEGTDQETMKSMIFEKTGFLPSITENGTLYVANMRLSLELLKEMCESRQGIVRITGDYTGGIGGR
jgi:type II secretory pathway predicted ATPase ExeA